MDFSAEIDWFRVQKKGSQIIIRAKVRRLFYIILWLGFLTGSALASPNSIRVGFAGFPLSNLFYIAFDEYSEAITQLVLEPLIRLNPDDLTPEPALASSFSAQPLQGQFEFILNPKARFSDGTPVTRDDVLFTCKTLKEAHQKGRLFFELLSSLISCESPSPQTVIFKMRTPFAAGFTPFSQFFVLSQKHFSKGDFLTAFNEQYVGSGPYKFEKVEWGKSITLQKNPNYWASQDDKKKGRYQFDQISFITQPDPNLLIKLLLQHEIDYLYFLSAKSWVSDTNGPLFKAKKIKKLEVANKIPFALAGIAWNLRNPLFQDQRVRKALAHLLNRERLIHDFFFNQYQRSTGIAYYGSTYHHPKNEPVGFDPLLAQSLLRETGWKLNNRSQLEKNGQLFSFEVLTGNPPAGKYLAFYQEDLRKVGIELKIKIVDWATYIKLRNAGQFEAIDFSRNRDEKMIDLETLWLSKEENGTPIDNLFGYQNPKANQLLYQLRKIPEEKDRVTLIQQLDRLISEDFPMAFTWEPKYQRIAYWDDYEFSPPGYHAFSKWNQLFSDWKRKVKS